MEDCDFNQFLKNTENHCKIMYLSLFIDTDDSELKQLYIESAKNHNSKIINDPHFYDAGFDLFLPKNNDTGISFKNGETTKVNFQVKCCAKIHNLDNNKTYYTAFYTYARSSMSKTPLRLANNQGIIDAGYRGNLIGVFDCIGNNIYVMEKYSRILQICSPGLTPMFVNIVDKIEDLGPSTSRGEGGFGSTGK